MAGQLVQDESGQIFYQRAGGVLLPITEEQAQAIDENPDAAENFLRSANLAITNLGTGAASLLSDDPKWEQLNKLGRQEAEALQMTQPMAGLLGSIAPQVAAGVATSGLGVLPTAGVEAALGAATVPENPVMGAVVGGGLGAAGAALPMLPGAVRGGYGRAKEMFGMGGASVDDALAPGVFRPGQAVDDIAAAADRGPSLPPGPASTTTSEVMPAGPGAAPGARPGPTSMAERQAAVIEQEGARAANEVAPTRVMGDMMTPDELAQYGVGVTPGQRGALLATNADDAAPKARALMEREEALKSHPILGRQFNELHDAQKASTTNFINDQLDLPTGIGITDGTLSEVMAGVGKGLDRIADEMGGVPIDKAIRDDLAEVMRLSTGKHKGNLQKVIDEAIQKADNNGGMLSGRDWQIMRTELNTQIEKGMKDGRIDWVNEASEAMGVFTRAMESNLPTEVARELARLRKQYAIGATLSKPGVRDTNGLINTTSFYNNWKRPQSLKHRGKDDIGRFMNTLNFLQTKRLPDSGTARRLGMMNTATKAAAGTALGAVGLGALGNFL